MCISFKCNLFYFLCSHNRTRAKRVVKAKSKIQLTIEAAQRTNSVSEWTQSRIYNTKKKNKIYLYKRHQRILYVMWMNNMWINHNKIKWETDKQIISVNMLLEVRYSSIRCHFIIIQVHCTATPTQIAQNNAESWADIIIRSSHIHRWTHIAHINKRTYPIVQIRCWCLLNCSSPNST